MGDIKSIREQAAEMIQAINAVLEDHWEKTEVQKGKEFDIPPSWLPLTRLVKNAYRKVGWSIQHKVEIVSGDGARRNYLTFKNPRWVKCSKDRSTGVSLT